MPESTMHKLLAFSQRYSVAVIVATGLLSVFFGYFALHIKLNSDIESLLPANDSVARLMKKYGGGMPKGDYFVVAARAKDGFSIEGLKAFHAAIGRIEKPSFALAATTK